jgi:ABC-type branched-subunit amino acid transport system substrate-binding protein
MFQGIGTDDDRDFSANISVIQGSGAEGFFWGGMYGQGGPLCVQMRQAGLNIPFVSGDGCFDQSFINTVGGNAANVFSPSARTTTDLPAAQPFLKSTRRSTGTTRAPIPSTATTPPTSCSPPSSRRKAPTRTRSPR